MRVLYLNPFSQEVSGPDESLRTLLAALAPLGVDAHVALPRPGPQVSRYEALGVTVHYVPLTTLKRRPGVGAVALPARLALGVAALARIARRERIDLIHTNMEVVLDGAVASRLLGLPHVLHYRGNTNDHPRIVFDLLTRFWTATAEKVLCISNATAELFRRRGLDARIETVYNPVDVGVFANAERCDAIRRDLGAGPDEFLVGTIGRIHPRKDVETFIRTAALVAKERVRARFVVVGSAEVREEVDYEVRLRSLATELGIADRVVWAGARRDIPRVMKALDVFVLCSRHEGFGRVIAEALASGLPIVATAEGAIPELLANSRGCTVRPADAAQFCAGVLKALAAPRRDDVSRVFAEQSFSSRQIALRVMRAYERAVQDRRDGRTPLGQVQS